MIELPTPETDALFYRNGYPEVVDSSKAMQLCEKLEQERDWITEKFKLLEGCFNRAERERDEALERERVAILSFDEERQRALREGERVLEARRERDAAIIKYTGEADELERQRNHAIAKCEDARRERDELREVLREILKVSEPTPVLIYQKMEDIASKALKETK